MNSSQSVRLRKRQSSTNTHTFSRPYLHQQLEVICDLIASVETTVLVGLVRDLEQAIYLLLIEADATS